MAALPLIAVYGRERETATIARVASTLAGAGLLIIGEPGIGRSTLLSVGVDAATAAGVRVITPSVPGSEDYRPLHLATEVLAALGHRRPMDTLSFDELLFTVLSEVARERPTLVAIDDAHHADAASWNALMRAARQLHEAPLALLATLPSAEARFGDAGIAELTVNPLSDEASLAVLAATNPGLPTFVRQRILEASMGNPLALQELAYATIEEWQRRCVRPPAALPLTPRLKRAFASPVDDLPAATQEVLLAAAANDSESLYEAARAAALTLGVPVETTLGACMPAIEQRIVEDDATTLRFRSEVARSALYQAAELSRRRAVHLAFAQLLTAPARRAWHRAAASLEPDEELACELERAGACARSHGRIRDALAIMDRAARVSEIPAAHARRLLAAAEMGFEIGRPDFAKTFTAQAGAVAESAEQQREVAWMRGLYDLWHPTGPDALLAQLQRAEAAYAEGDGARTRTALTRAIEKVEVLSPSAIPREALDATAARLGGIRQTPALAGVLTAAMPVERGAEILAAMGSSYEDAVHDPRLARLLGESAAMLGHDAHAILSLTASIERLRADGRLGLLPFALVDRARAHVSGAGLHLARLDADEAAELAIETGPPIVLGRARAVQALIEGIAGRPQEARERALEAEQLALGRPALLVDVHVARGLTDLVCGDHEGAYGWLKRLWAPTTPMMAVGRQWARVGDLAEAALVCGEAAAVRPIVEELSNIAIATPSPALRAATTRAVAVLARDEDDAEDLFVRALTAAADHGSLSLGRTHLAYGTWLRRERRITDARLELRAAVAAFDQVGAHPWSERARGELRAAGEGVVMSPVGFDELTAQEREIAQLAASGLTNREIGKRMFLSHRTISTHLYRIFPKLGITSRAHLRDALATPAQLEPTEARDVTRS